MPHLSPVEAGALTWLLESDTANPGVRYFALADLLDRPAMADYPTPFGGKPSSSWFKFGYPLGYVTDVLQNLEALAAARFGEDPRVAHGLDLVRRKQDAQGRWKMEYTYNGKMWADVETPGQPSKWVTLRALRLLKRAGQLAIPAGFAG